MAEPREKTGASDERPIAIVDIDGTIADVSHRLHHIEGRRRNWKRFFEAMHEDSPIPDVIAKVRELARTHEIVMLTGRPESYEEVTVEWLKAHEVPFDRLLMRGSGDRRQDYVTKEELLRRLPRGRAALAIDDRAPVCEMYRRHGLEVIEIGSSRANQEVNELYRQKPE